MAAGGFPRTISRGPLAGRHFTSRAEYRAALAAARGVPGRTEYAIRSERARMLGFDNYAQLRRAQLRGEFPTAKPGGGKRPTPPGREQVATSGTTKRGNAWRVGLWTSTAGAVHDVEHGGRAPVTGEMADVDRVAIHVERVGWATVRRDGLWPDDVDAFQYAADDIEDDYLSGAH